MVIVDLTKAEPFYMKPRFPRPISYLHKHYLHLRMASARTRLFRHKCSLGFSVCLAYSAIAKGEHLFRHSRGRNPSNQSTLSPSVDQSGQVHQEMPAIILEWIVFDLVVRPATSTRMSGSLEQLAFLGVPCRKSSYPFDLMYIAYCKNVDKC